MLLFRAYDQRFLNTNGSGLHGGFTAVLLSGVRFWRRSGLLAGGSRATHINYAVPPMTCRPHTTAFGESDSQAMPHLPLHPEMIALDRQSEGQPGFLTRLARDDGRTGGSSPGTSVITKVKPKTKRPNLYRVLILNDDYTPMEFVVHVLEKFFQKDIEAATKIMLHVHHHGIGECGVFTYEIAETKVTQVMDFARKHQHPLQCVMEKK